MSGFGFSEDAEMLRKLVHEFCHRELAPGAKQRSKLNYYPKELRKKIGEVGYFGIQAPEKYGGQPLDWVSAGIVAEELGSTDLAAAVLFHHALASVQIILQGAEELQEEWIPDIIRGEKIACFLITEPECGSDAAAIKLQAIRDGDTYVLRGEKTSVTYGTQSDVALVWAKTDPTQGGRGVTAFLVPTNLPGLDFSAVADMGFKPMERCSIFFDDVRIPASNQIGEKGKGFSIVLGSFDFLRIFLSLEVLGLARTSLEMAIAYAKERTAFGRPIAKFEGVSFKIAEAATLLEAARLLCYRSLWLRDQGIGHTKESAMCKWFAPQVAVRIIHDSLLIHGHYGYSEEYPIEQYLRDAIGYELADGSAEIMKIIISRGILGREFLPY